MDAPTSTAKPLRAVGLFLLATVAFALAYTQAPLYYSNQNQYFVHGLAAAGFGHLDEDWLANTVDPTPLFTALVAFTHRSLDERLFYAYYALLMGVYFVGLVGLFRVVADSATGRAPLTPGPSPRAQGGGGEKHPAPGEEDGGVGGQLLPTFLFAALLLALHAALPRYASVRLLGTDYPWYLQAGVAGQYLLGDMFQPSAFGVLFVPALYLFARDRPLAAATCSSLAAVVHATYLLPAALLTVAFLGVLLYRRQVRRAVLVGVAALVIVLPVVVYALTHFRPTTADQFAEAQRVIAHFRIPHHAVVALWADNVALAQIGWVVLGIALARGTPLFAVLLVTFLLSAALTLLQMATGSDALALLFPWRTSTFLVPVATTVILARLVLPCVGGGQVPARRRRLGWGCGFALTAVAVGGGVWVMAAGQGYQVGDEDLALLAHVRGHAAPGQTYLIPVPVPNLAKATRGSRASAFLPLSRKRGDSRLIPVDLQRFRLHAGVPIYVDFKSIPYKDAEVLEWRARLGENSRLYERMKAEPCAAWLPELRRLGVTHVVTTARDGLDCPELRQDYADGHYRLYAVAR